MLTLARKLLPGLLAGACLALAGLGRPAGPPPVPADIARPAPAPRGVVYLAGRLSEEDLLVLGSAVRPGDVLLLDTGGPAGALLRHYLAQRPPALLVGVGAFQGGRAAVKERLGALPGTRWRWAKRPSELWPRVPGHVVVCPPRPRAQLLQAAWLAGLLRAPLWVSDGGVADRARLRQYAGASDTATLVLVGGVRGGVVRANQELELEGAAEVAAFGRQVLSAAGATPAVAVVANPHDAETGQVPGRMSSLAPWLAASKKAPLLLTNAAGTDVAALVAAEQGALIDTVLLAADLRAVPTERRLNPLPWDRDETIEMEPLTPPEGGTFSYAIGRLFHPDRAVVPLLLARQDEPADRPGPRRALVASNPGRSLALMEAFSRNTAHELTRAGYEVRQLYGDQLTARSLRHAMVGPEIILWEGHHNTLVQDWKMPSWDEPLRPALVFLQSCLALQEEKALPLMTRGAAAVVGSSTRVYSASGGALALAFMNALLYDGETLGGALRQAKNFMTCYAALKEKRLGEQAQRAGANHRAAWAFTLWGDPTLRPARPPGPGPRPGVRHEVVDNAILLHVPEEAHPLVTSGKYRVRMPPNARLAGLVRKAGDDRSQPLVPFAFAEVALPGGPAGHEPRLRSRLPAGSWVFLWDARRQVGHLLARPRAGAREVRFEVEWVPSPGGAGHRPAQGEQRGRAVADHVTDDALPADGRRNGGAGGGDDGAPLPGAGR